MDPTIQIIVTIFSSMLGSAGLWSFLTTKTSKNSWSNQMLIGLAHDRIIELGMKYIERGYITQDEYENLNRYLYTPYKGLGGNGSATRIMAEVDKLPIRNHNKED